MLSLKEMFRNWRIISTKSKCQFDIDMENTKLDNEINKLKNEQKMLNAKISLSKAKFEHEKVTSKLNQLENSKKLFSSGLTFGMIILMFFSSIITPMGFGLLDHFVFTSFKSFKESFVNSMGFSVLFIAFFLLQIIGFGISSRNNPIELFFSKDHSRSSIILKIFIPLSIIGNFVCFINWIGGGFLNILFLLSCSILLELMIHFLIGLKHNVKDRNYSFKEDSIADNLNNMSIIHMGKQIINNVLISKMFDNYILAQESLIEKSNKLSDLKNNIDKNLNSIEQNNIDQNNIDTIDKSLSNNIDTNVNNIDKNKNSIDTIISDKENNTEPIANPLHGLGDNLVKKISNNSNINKHVSDNLVKNENNIDKNNLENNIENNIVKNENSIDKNKNNIDTINKSHSNNIDPNQNNIDQNKKLTTKQVEEIILGHVNGLKDNEKFDKSNLDYLNISDSRIRNARTKLVKEGLLYTLNKKGTFKTPKKEEKLK